MNGANKTQIFLISIGNAKKSVVHLIKQEVNISPGYTVPPTTLPKGNQDSESNQFQNP
jgi:hypothetical protein